MTGPRQGGGQTDPMSGGGGTAPQFAYQNLGPMSGLQAGSDQLRSAQQNLQRVQARCAQGDGYACIQAQQLQERMGQMQMGHQQQMQSMMGRGQGGTMGVNRPGGFGRGQDPRSYTGALLQSMYGGRGW